MKISRIICLAAFIASMAINVSCSQKCVIKGSDEELMRNWISTLGADDYAGRKPMTEYETKSVNFIADQMKLLGLEPAFDGSYFQEMKMISTTVRFPDNRIDVKGRKGETSLIYAEDFIAWNHIAENIVTLKDAEYVFCGFGINAPEFGWNDYDGLDVKGKIVIAMVNDPGYYDSNLFRGKNMTYYGRWIYKFEEAIRQGAAGCLVLHETDAASYGWNVCTNGHSESNLGLYDETNKSAGLSIKGWISQEGGQKLFKLAGIDMKSAVESAKKPGFKAISLGVKSDITMNVSYRVSGTMNVAGILPGSDLKDEALVISGHWDHLGIGPADATGDSIYNGAADNASGVAAVLLLAKKFKELPQKPRRSIIFISVTCEESGLFGSQFYCEHPVIPMDKTATVLNFDCIAPEHLTKDILILRGGESDLDEIAQKAAETQGRYIYFSDDNSDGWYYRSDHYNFVKKGVPAFVMGNGIDPADPEHVNKYPKKSWYHTPSDEYLEDWDMEGTIANVDFMFEVGKIVANSDDLPKWKNN